MQVVINRCIERALRRPFTYVLSSTSFQDSGNSSCDRWQLPRSFGVFVQGFVSGNAPVVPHQHAGQYFLGGHGQRLHFCTDTVKLEEGPTEAVHEVYLKMLKSVESENMPPNAWRDSLLENCKNREDVKLAFLILENLRIFRLSKQRLYSNYTQQISLRLVSACIRADAPDLGLKTLWKHNVYGITPCVGAAHSLLLYSKEQKNIHLMEEILLTMEKNSIQLQPTTADIVFSICSDTESWDLMSKCAKKFLKNGVKLHRCAYDIWISYAAKIDIVAATNLKQLKVQRTGDDGTGDSTKMLHENKKHIRKHYCIPELAKDEDGAHDIVFRKILRFKHWNAQRVWKIQELRSNSGLKHTVPSAFACAKAHLLRWQPQDAAGIILTVNEENLSESKRKWIYEELQRLVDEWPVGVISRRDKGHRKAFSSELKDCIAMMFNTLINMGLNISLSVEDRFCSKSTRSLDETVPC